MTAAVKILREERDKKASEIDALVARVRILKSDVKTLEDAIATLEDALPAPVASTGPRASSFRSLKIEIADILAQAPGLSTQEIGNALIAIQRETDANTILGTLSRAKREGLVHKSGRVWFAGAGPQQTEQEGSTDDGMGGL